MFFFSRGEKRRRGSGQVAHSRMMPIGGLSLAEDTDIPMINPGSGMCKYGNGR